MGYALPDDVRSVIAGQQDSADGTAASLTDAELQIQIDEASARIDATLAEQYQTPFADPVPSLVSKICVDLAAYLADLSYRQNKAYTSTSTPLLMRYQWAMEMLKGLYDGSMVLPPGTPQSESGGAILVNDHQQSLFTVNDFDLYIQPPRYQF